MAPRNSGCPSHHLVSKLLRLPKSKWLQHPEADQPFRVLLQDRQALCCSLFLYLAEGQSPQHTKSSIRAFLSIVYFFCPSRTIMNLFFVIAQSWYIKFCVHDVAFPMTDICKKIVLISSRLDKTYYINIFFLIFMNCLLIEIHRIAYFAAINFISFIFDLCNRTRQFQVNTYTYKYEMAFKALLYF